MAGRQLRPSGAASTQNDTQPARKRTAPPQLLLCGIGPSVGVLRVPTLVTGAQLEVFGAHEFACCDLSSGHEMHNLGSPPLFHDSDDPVEHLVEHSKSPFSVIGTVFALAAHICVALAKLL